jgi:membrane protein DedA with SNARE-associated domain
MTSYFEPLVDFVGAHPQLSFLAVFLLALSEAVPVIGTVVPGSTLILAISALATTVGISPWALLVAAVLGAIAGDGFSFWLGHRYHRQILSGWPLNRFPWLIERSARFIRKYGITSVFLARFTAVVRAFVPLLAGILRMSSRHFYVANILSALVWAPMHVFPGVAPVGRQGVEDLLRIVADPNDKRVPDIARACLAALGAQLRRIKEQILEFDRMIRAWHRSSEMSRRLDDCPGVGPALATAVVASVADPMAFKSGRNFSAWIGLVPKQHSSGGKERLGGISKQGDRYLRGLFVAGALAVIRYAKIHGTRHRPWLTALLARRPTKVAAIALANKIARMVWAMMARGKRYKEPVALAA